MPTTKKQAALGYMICVDNSGYPAALELGKAYKVIPDENIEPDELRVVDESGEDYIYPASYFSTERPSESTPQPPEPALYSDIEREARGFIDENEPLLSEGSTSALQRVYIQGANIFTAFSEEAIEAADRLASATNALAEAMNNSATPPRRLQELETEQAHASRIHEARNATFQEFRDFLERVKVLLPDQPEE